VPPSTEQLIAELAAGAEPVRRLRPPLLRALFWLIGVAAIGAIVVPFYGDFGLFSEKTRDPKFVIELAGTLLTGMAAVIAAFELSMPDRSPAWAWLPVPPFVLWLASSGYNCWRDWITLGDQGWRLGESAECFGTIIGFSIPLGVALLIFLARAKPLAFEITKNHLTPDAEGSLRLPDAPGLGIDIDPEALRRYLVDVEIKVGGKTIFASTAEA